jgi:hypothetical protein
MTLGRTPPLADNAGRKIRLAALRSRLGGTVKSMVPANGVRCPGEKVCLAAART